MDQQEHQQDQQEQQDRPAAGATPAEPAAPRPSTDRFFDGVRAWGAVRDDEDRWFAGVAGALARRWDVDPVVVRGAFIGLTVVGGLGFAAYGIGWALLPDARGRIEAEAASRGDVSGSLAGAVALLLLDLLVGRGLLGAGAGWWNAGAGWGFFITAALAGVGWWLLRDRIALVRPGQRDPRAAQRPDPSGPAAPTGAPVDLTKHDRLPHEDVPLDARVERAVDEALAPLRTLDPLAGHRSTTERRAAARRAAAERAAAARARRRPGSPLLSAAATGLALLAAGAVTVAHRAGYLPGTEVATALAAAVAVLALGALLAALRGRRSALQGLAWPLALVALALTLAPPSGGWRWSPDLVWSPTAREDAVAVPVGRLRVDLEEGTAGGSATVAAGRLEVVVPQERTVLVEATALSGSVRWERADVVAVADGRGTFVDDDAGPRVRATGGLNVRAVLAVGPDARAVAEAARTDRPGDDRDGWSVPAGTDLLRATAWAGEVALGAPGGDLLGTD
ncbi:PspC domain-containing protein [Kineococcus terrestris]|uniref:PspC domain-containing protein n=1 Tax=Kineococcus terrestris TaxID=2044856 RepID=UPI0034DB6500